jgi:hypothetical protein
MAKERIFPGKRVVTPSGDDGWIFNERIICDTCKAAIGEQQEYVGGLLDKYRHGEYPGYRCTSCTGVANHAYDNWATSAGRFSDSDRLDDEDF